MKSRLRLKVGLRLGLGCRGAPERGAADQGAPPEDRCEGDERYLAGHPKERPLPVQGPGSEGEDRQAQGNLVGLGLGLGLRR